MGNEAEKQGARLRLGYHVSVAGGIFNAFGRAEAMGCETMQIFLSNPRGWDVAQVSNGDIKKFLEMRAGHHINPVVAHMPYLPNLSTSDASKMKKSIESLSRTLSLSASLGVDYLVAHLGSHGGAGTEKGMANVVSAINKVEIPDNVSLLLENTAGGTNSVGSSLEDLAMIREGISDQKRIGFCLDTCHLYAAGYDLADTDVASNIRKRLGTECIRIFHLNDAKFELGSKKDRHANIGQGYIGEAGFRKFLGNAWVRSKPLILETPENTPEEILLVRKLAKG